MLEWQGFNQDDCHLSPHLPTLLALSFRPMFTRPAGFFFLLCVFRYVALDFFLFFLDFFLFSSHVVTATGAENFST